MSLTMKEKKALTRETRDRYKKASKKQKGEILERFTWLTKYNRSYAARILRQKQVPGEEKKKAKRKRKKKYGAEVLLALRKIWAICDGICGKRLAPFLPEIIPILESWGELKITEEVREKLLKISAATIDRLLAPSKEVLSAQREMHHQTRQPFEKPDTHKNFCRLGGEATWLCGGRFGLPRWG